jgi:Tfp pilus assembly protein PilN
MPAKKETSKLINLLPQEEFTASTIGRILTWLLSSFRIIVIVSEMVVMGAFISRFWLDAKNADLSDEIEQKEAIVNSYKTFEEDFRSIQKKLLIFSSVSRPSEVPSQTLETLVAILPQEISLTGLETDKKTITVTGTTAEESPINTYIASLKFTKLFSEVEVVQLNFDSTKALINFTIQAKTGEERK